MVASQLAPVYVTSKHLAVKSVVRKLISVALGRAQASLECLQLYLTATCVCIHLAS